MWPKFGIELCSLGPFLFLPRSACSMGLCQGGGCKTVAHLLCKQGARFPGRASAAAQAGACSSPISRALTASLCVVFFFFLFLGRFRLMCNKIITHKMFDHIVLVIIFLNCITIAMERPKIEPHSAVSLRLMFSVLQAGVFLVQPAHVACTPPPCIWALSFPFLNGKLPAYLLN